jgi:hypothetical protein
MAKESEKKTPSGFAALNQFTIEFLQGKYGQDVQVSSTTSALKAVIDLIERDSVVAAGVTISVADGEYCKQTFDRTNPGYSKLYDKCSDILTTPEDPEIAAIKAATTSVRTRT